MPVYSAMAQPLRVDFVAFRNSPWPASSADEWQFDIDGVVIPVTATSPHAMMQIRLYEDAPDPPLITLDSTTSSGTRFIITDAVNYLFKPFITQASLEGLPDANDGQPLGQEKVVFTHDIRIGNTGLERVVAYGLFTVYTGTTR